MQICLKCIQHLLKTSFERKHGITVLLYTKAWLLTLLLIFFLFALKLFQEDNKSNLIYYLTAQFQVSVENRKLL